MPAGSRSDASGVVSAAGPVLGTPRPAGAAAQQGRGAERPRDAQALGVRRLAVEQQGGQAGAAQGEQRGEEPGAVGRRQAHGLQPGSEPRQTTAGGAGQGVHVRDRGPALRRAPGAGPAGRAARRREEWGPASGRSHGRPDNTSTCGRDCHILAGTVALSTRCIANPLSASGKRQIGLNLRRPKRGQRFLRYVGSSPPPRTGSSASSSRACIWRG